MAEAPPARLGAENADAGEGVVQEWVVTAARAADAKQGADVIVLAVGEVLAITGWFVITSAGNPRLVRTIADAVEDEVAAGGGPRPMRVEGLDDLRWVLMDYGDFVVHVFSDEARQYYDLERLWRDSERLDWRQPASGAARP